MHSPLASPKVIILLRVKHQSQKWVWSRGDITVAQAPSKARKALSCVWTYRFWIQRLYQTYAQADLVHVNSRSVLQRQEETPREALRTDLQTGIQYSRFPDMFPGSKSDPATCDLSKNAPATSVKKQFAS